MELFTDRYVIPEDDLWNIVSVIIVDVEKPDNTLDRYSIITKGVPRWKKGGAFDINKLGHYRIKEIDFKFIKRGLFYDVGIIEQEDLKDTYREINKQLKKWDEESLLKKLEPYKQELR